MIVNGEVEERPLTPHEIMAMSLLVLVGGLDTVASQIGFVAHFLAKNPGHRRELIEDPKLIQTACEELLRRSGRSEEYTSELQSLMRISYAVFRLTKKYHAHN